ncbi:hypothetical protein JTB14_035123 [Gonioctena quinquepunctata]|nr:hypothetical protein JTB14_035123 [Gonioctena quinquepunctata]
MKLLLCILFSSFILEGLSIKCWICRSDLDPDCGDPYNNRTLAISDCKYVSDYGRAEPTRCRKEVKNENGNVTIFRSCGHRADLDLMGDETFCRKGPELNSSSVEVCTCNDKDGCNASSVVRISSILLSISMFLFFMMEI